MLWNSKASYKEEPFEREADLEAAILEVEASLFGENRIYLETKKLIGAKGKTRNIPDGYLLDLSSKKKPRLFVVENELARHDPLKHIAVQILEFSLSFETSQHRVKEIIKDALVLSKSSLEKCQDYAARNGRENVDVLLEEMIYGKDCFAALVIIDELSEELEKVLMTRFQFPVETLTLQRYSAQDGERLYKFEPFMEELTSQPTLASVPRLDPSEIDTVVVPARDEGFDEVFLGEDRWYKIRMHASMLPRIKYCAVYRVAPESAITHIARVRSIEPWPDSNKYVLNFEGPAEGIGPLKLLAQGAVKAPQGARYTSRARLASAKNLDEAF